MGRLERLNKGEALPAYAYPGKYPLIYLSMDFEVMCPECADDCLHNPDDPRKPRTSFIYSDTADPLKCVVCGKPMPRDYEQDEVLDD